MYPGTNPVLPTGRKFGRITETRQQKNVVATGKICGKRERQFKSFFFFSHSL
jgi:hypothetical protein